MNLTADLAGQVALVTGGTRGLGRQMAEAFADAGADVVVVGRSADHCERAAAEIAERTRRRVVGIACHVGDWSAVDALVDATYRAFPTVDILVNNAGISPLYDSPSTVSEQLWDKVVGVNLKGPFRLSALVGERMMSSARGGSIINLSSAAAQFPRPDVVPYAAAKAGLNAMTIAMAHALGPNVRVNCIQPGAFLTDIAKAWDQELFSRQARGFAMRRAGRPNEVVGAALYLASDASSYTTGSVLRVDGGYTWSSSTDLG